MLTGKEQQLFDALAPRAQLEGIEIVTIEITGARKAPTIRVYIDTDHGVGFDELSSAQSWINDILDEVDPFPGAYTLEVSSPGIDRPLRTAEHFARFIGGTAVVKTAHAIDGRSAWTGTIAAVEGGNVTIDADGTVATIPVDDIKRAHLKGVIDFGSQA